MRLVFVADGRSPIAQNWIRFFTERGDEVYLASTFPCTPALSLRGLEVTPVAFSSGATASTNGAARSSGDLALRWRMTIRHFLGPRTVSRASGRLRAFIDRVRPELVHAMRIPFEGMLAADAYSEVPLIVSVWGNDFTLHAPSSALMRHYTSWTMQVANGLHADCQRDVRLSRQWGYATSKPSLVAPGNGGVRLDVFHPPSSPVAAPIVFNPRGARTYVRNDVFFDAIPLVLARRPDARFVCAALRGDASAAKRIAQLGIQSSVELLDRLPHSDMANAFRQAQLMISLGVHDGTPNSLLEAMACGCLPIAGDLESIREWITNGRNGLLVDPTDPHSVAQAILEALDNENLRREAAGFNWQLVKDRAEYGRCMSEAANFYGRLISRG